MNATQENIAFQKLKLPLSLLTKTHRMVIQREVDLAKFTCIPD